MPSLLLTTETNKLDHYYKTLSWFGRLFFPGQLQKQLANHASPLIITQTAFSSTWFFQRWFLSGLGAFFQSDVVRASEGLLNAHALPGGKTRVEENINFINTRPDSLALATALFGVNKANNFALHQAQHNLNRIKTHAEQSDVTNTLMLLDQANLLSTDHAQANFNHVLRHSDLNDLHQALSSLDDGGMLQNNADAQLHFDTVVQASDPKITADGLLRGEERPSQPEQPQESLRQQNERRDSEQRGREEALNNVIDFLTNFDLFGNDDTFDRVWNHSNPIELNRALTDLRDAGFLDHPGGSITLQAARNNLHQVLLSPSQPQLIANTMIGRRPPAANNTPSPFDELFLRMHPPSRSTRAHPSAPTDNNQRSLGTLARSYESSMRHLSSAEEDQLQAAQAHYQPRIDRLGGVEPCFRTLVAELERRYQQAAIRIPGLTRPLPLTWEAFEALNLRGELRDRALTAYYENKTHTALRFLSRPNHWMSENSVHTDSDYQNGRTIRFSHFEQFKPLIVLHWLGASDASTPPTVASGFTLETRIDAFIAALADVGRGHNWDDERVKLNAQGKRISEYFDDTTQGDKSSCTFGIKARLFQSVQGHPLFTASLSMDILEQELIEFVREQFRQHIQQLSTADRATLVAAWDELIEMGILSPGAHTNSINAINITDHAKTIFFQGLSRKYETFNDNPGFRLALENRFVMSTTFTSHAARFGGDPINLSALLLEAPAAKHTPSSHQSNSFLRPQTAPREQDNMNINSFLNALGFNN